MTLKLRLAQLILYVRPYICPMPYSENGEYMVDTGPGASSVQ